MGERLPIYLPRVAVLVIAVLAATAGLTFAAGQTTPSALPAPAATTAAKEPLLVPDLRNQAFVFAKGQLQDLGFAWKVAGRVQGFAANTVVSQSPAPGTKLVDTGAPLIRLTLERNRQYGPKGVPEDTSPYSGTATRLAGTS